MDQDWDDAEYKSGDGDDGMESKEYKYNRKVGYIYHVTTSEKYQGTKHMIVVDEMDQMYRIPLDDDEVQTYRPLQPVSFESNDTHQYSQQRKAAIIGQSNTKYDITAQDGYDPELIYDMDRGTHPSGDRCYLEGVTGRTEKQGGRVVDCIILHFR